MEGSGGYRTRQRELIEQFLVANRERHLSVDEVVDYLRGQGSPVGRSTVYRCLDRLVVQGAVRRYFLEEGAGACYQYAGKGTACREHFHLKCIGCGRLIHVECDYLDEVARHVLEHHHFTIDNTKTVLYGFCESCAQKA
ncbi:Fur family transcriptional regulator [Anaerotruncus rubiinfantis]|uniref:Fur family transcriptional regulator n=1 Tax=Anaerotruncus rubiinfantis TaxID=1720200 RepID=UPI00083237EE|nr:transcriptional repressor [Anaerotruncus rubiinfantis]